MINQAVIGLGSNIEPGKNISAAKRLIAQKYKILAASKFILTKPVGCSRQPDFLNGALLLQTTAKRHKVKETMKAIEHRLGRKKQADKFAPRTIDLDIVAWNGKVVDQNFYQRDFLRQSVLELIPNLKY